MDSIRIWRSPLTRFGKFTQALDDPTQNETVTADAVYTDGELARIAASGFNAIWVHGLLRNLVKSEVFPEFGEHAALHQKHMNALIGRAARHGLKVFVFMQPPRGIWAESPFWTQHPEVAGGLETVGATPVRCLCTSTEKVKRYLRTSAASLARKLPGLGGLILITASEYPAHCWSRRGLMCDEMGHVHMRATECPRCVKRRPGEVVNEIIQLVRDGIRSISADMEILCWSWAWTAYEKEPSPRIIRQLPRDVLYMAVFEAGHQKLILGKKRDIEEYSLSFAGPSERFVKSTTLARKAGLRCAAKLQFGTTHELATVPNLPLIGNIYDKAAYMRKKGISSFMGCWNFGNMITANTAAFNRFLVGRESPSKAAALESFAAEYFPGCDARRVARAWRLFARAMDNYPFSIPFLYGSPINYTLAYPLRPGPVGKIPCGGSWRTEKVRGDNLDGSLEGYTLAEVIKGFELLHQTWKEGLDLFEQGVAASTGEHRREELATAKTCYHVFRSVWNTYRVYRLKRRWTAVCGPAFLAIAKDELANLEAVLPVVKGDLRQGFHGEAFAYMFDAVSIERKIRQLKREKRKQVSNRGSDTHCPN